MKSGVFAAKNKIQVIKLMSLYHLRKGAVLCTRVFRYTIRLYVTFLRTYYQVTEWI